jgi:GNAT superfamily N-acetyltransferase
MVVESLSLHEDGVGEIARWHFRQWGTLTGCDTLDAYLATLERYAGGHALPQVLVAIEDLRPLGPAAGVLVYGPLPDGSLRGVKPDRLLGTATLLPCDMHTRPLLTPWLGQLFVSPQFRRRDIGAALVRATIERARASGFQTLHLYTSGDDLPGYYRRLGWAVREPTPYLGKERVIMEYALGA